jgi:hypothetical protein
MSGFQDRELIAALSSPIAAVRVQPREEQSPATAPEGGTSGKPKAGKGPIHRRSGNPSEACGRRRTKTPFPDGRSRKVKVCGLLQCETQRPNRTRLWLKFNITIPRRPRSFPLFKIPVPGEMCGARHMAHIDSEKMEEGRGRRSTKDQNDLQHLTPPREDEQTPGKRSSPTRRPGRRGCQPSTKGESRRGC